MAYTQFDPSKPDGTSGDGASYTSGIHDNFKALRDAVIMGDMEGWNLSYSGGTADQPDYHIYSKGTERVRLHYTWNTDGYITEIVYEYSSDSGSTYDTIGTETITYDADYNVTATTWS